jgi:hypothetical protein
VVSRKIGGAMMEESNRCENCGERGDPENVKKYISSILAGDSHVAVESKLLTYALASALILMILGFFGYGLLFKAFVNAINATSFLLIVIITSVILTFTYFHMLCYKKNLSCSNGMMIGMTVGMVAGFVIGAVVAATNGMFIGAVVGIAFGIYIGFALGKHCGIMGALEAIMAGLMSGLMGSMTSIMLLNDNMMAMIYIIIGIGAVTLGGLSYMMHREAGHADMRNLKANFIDFLVISVLISAGLLLIMVFGPKGPLTYI